MATRLTRASRNGPIDVRVPKTAELVAIHIRKQIVRGELQQGDALPTENALMEEFSISRPTLREAFRILESEGLITVRRGAQGGARVQVPSAQTAAGYAGLVLQHRGTTLADVLSVRSLVEAPAARLVAERRDRKRCADELEKVLDEFDVTTPERFSDFNARLVELTGSETLMLITAMLEHIVRGAALSFVHTPHPVDDETLTAESDRARRKVVALIRAGDAEGAETLWHKHLTAQGKVLGESLRGSVIELFD
jgi:GntR family transcriptional regulator, transcriptional repressor for pyruvate dehydrogenase complex